jgi:hypothetical protein
MAQLPNTGDQLSENAALRQDRLTMLPQGPKLLEYTSFVGKKFV